MVGFEKPSSMPVFRVLSEDALQDIHWASLDVLSKTGVKVYYGENVLKTLKDEGCVVDFEKETVWFTPSMVEEAVRKASKVSVRHGRNPKYDYKLDGRHVYFTTDTETPSTIDLETGEWRTSTNDDLAKLTRVTDALSYASGGALTSSYDKPIHLRALYDYTTALNNMEKPFGRWRLQPPELAQHILEYQFEIAALIAGGEKALRKRPLGRGGFGSLSPLGFDGRMVDVTFKMAKQGFPCSVYAMPLTGATAPVTLAGSLVLTNAEILGGVAMIQLAAPGTGVSASYALGSFDMRYGKYAGGAPEESLVAAAQVEIARHYGFHTRINGLVDSSKKPGAQACYEKVVSGVLPVLAGADVVYGAGGLEGGMTSSYEELVIDDEIGKALLTLIQGVEVNDETLALDVIHEVGPGGHFLDSRHTFDHFTKEHFFPELADRSSYQDWKKAGGKGLVEKAREKAREILRDHQPTPLDEDIQKEISNIIKKADIELRKEKKVYAHASNY